MNLSIRQIVVIGDCALQACIEMAQRREAKVVQIDRTEEILEAPERYLTAELTYVVGLLDDLTLKAIESLHQFAARHPQGAQLCLLVGDTPDQLRRSVARIEARPSVGGGAVQTTASTGIALTPQSIHVVELDAATATNGSAPSDALFLFAHGNGLEMAAGPSGVLCRRDELSAAEGLRQGLPCFNGAACAMVLQNKRRLPLSAMHARRLIAGSCFVMMPGSAPYDRALSIGVGLLDLPLLECIVGTTTVTTVDSAVANLLAFFVLSGLPFAEATRRINKHLVKLGRPVRFCCFGDGETRLEKRLVDARLQFDDARPHLARLVLDDDAPAVDVRVALPRGFGPGDDQTFLVSTGAAGAVFFEEPEGAVLFMTLSPESRRSSQGLVSIRRLRQRGLQERMHAVLGQADFVRTLDSVLSRANGQGAPSLIRQRLDGLTERIVSSRFMRDIIHGDVVDAAELVATQQWLTGGIVDIQGALTDAYRRFVACEGVMPPYQRWSWAVDYNVPKESDRSCIYSASHGVMEAAEYRSIVTSMRRYIDYCLVCGPMRDAPAFARPTLEAEQGALRGGVLALTAHFNAQTRGLVLSGSAYVKQFDAPQALECRLTGAGHPEATEDVLSGVLQVPESYPPGVYHVGAMLLRDLDVAFVRRPLSVR